MNEEQIKINEAFEKFLRNYLSPEDRKQIAAVYGEQIAEQVRTIYDEALNAPVDWGSATMDSALDSMHEFLDQKYPWLSPVARTKINHAFIMVWK